MHATELLFPRPATIAVKSTRIRWRAPFHMIGGEIPAWLYQRLSRACRKAGISFARTGRHILELQVEEERFRTLQQPEIRAQAYRLEIAVNGSIRITGGGTAGLQYGIITLCHLLEAYGAGAELRSLTIRDYPLFNVRGIQIDLAREFFPPRSYLRRVIDRLVDLKINTLWLYLESHFRAPGLEDISPRKGMSPRQARFLSAYGRLRGVDVVPATNVASHMEGWFRLERYSDFCDGKMRSHPVLTDPRTMPLVKRYLNELIKAFPSQNFHVGLDELLFTGTNPAAARSIARNGKAVYFGRFARQVIRYLQRQGKTVWIWDDMVLGKNVFRKEGFNEEWRKALAYIPKDTLFTHWFYGYDARRHKPIMARVAAAGRPFVVVPSSNCQVANYGHIHFALANQTYMATVGRKYGALGFVCTAWECRHGHSFEATWPILAVSAQCAWRAIGLESETDRLGFSFVLTGETDGTLARYLCRLAELEDRLRGMEARHDLIVWGPAYLWQRWSPVLPPAARRQIAALLRQSACLWRELGQRDPSLRQALRLPLVLLTESLAILRAFDRAWAFYHRAAERERAAGAARGFRQDIRRAVSEIRMAADAVRRYRRQLCDLQATGHTPYDAYALDRHAAQLINLARRIFQVAEERNGLPYFGKLLYWPDSYQVSNLRQFRLQNTYQTRRADLPWPIRWIRNKVGFTGGATAMTSAHRK